MRLTDYLDKGASLGPEAPCLRMEDRCLSYGEVQRLSHRIARALEAAGVLPGEKVAILSGNDPIAFSCVFGIARAGAVWCPVNPRNEYRENAELLAGTDCKLLIFHSDYAEMVARMDRSAVFQKSNSGHAIIEPLEGFEANVEACQNAFLFGEQDRRGLKIWRHQDVCGGVADAQVFGQCAVYQVADVSRNLHTCTLHHLQNNRPIREEGRAYFTFSFGSTLDDRQHPVQSNFRLLCDVVGN